MGAASILVCVREPGNETILHFDFFYQLGAYEAHDRLVLRLLYGCVLCVCTYHVHHNHYYVT